MFLLFFILKLFDCPRCVNHASFVVYCFFFLFCFVLMADKVGHPRPWLTCMCHLSLLVFLPIRCHQGNAHSSLSPFLHDLLWVFLRYDVHRYFRPWDANPFFDFFPSLSYRWCSWKRSWGHRQCCAWWRSWGRQREGRFVLFSYTDIIRFIVPRSVSTVDMNLMLWRWSRWWWRRQWCQGTLDLGHGRRCLTWRNSCKALFCFWFERQIWTCQIDLYFLVSLSQ